MASSKLVMNGEKTSMISTAKLKEIAEGPSKKKAHKARMELLKRSNKRSQV